MPHRIPSAGDTAEAQCTRCRTLTNHTIVAMVGERIARVECNTCGGVHNYRAPAVSVTKEPRKKEPTPRKSAGATSAEREWQRLQEAVASSTPVAYQMVGRYKPNDVVQHPVFGLGIVQEVIKPGKMEVLFQTGKKLLRCTT